MRKQGTNSKKEEDLQENLDQRHLVQSEFPQGICGIEPHKTYNVIKKHLDALKVS